MLKSNKTAAPTSDYISLLLSSGKRKKIPLTISPCQLPKRLIISNDNAISITFPMRRKSMHACFLFIERAQISPQKEIVNINQTMTAIIINFLLEYSHTSFVCVYPIESNKFLLEFRRFGYTFELCV